MKKTANTSVSGSTCIHAGRPFSVMDGVGMERLFPLPTLLWGEGDPDQAAMNSFHFFTM